MNSKLLNALKSCETDVDGALERFYGDEILYIDFLHAFVKETTMTSLRDAIRDKKWEDAFMAGHALKGVAANLGFIPLFHAVGELVLLLRSGSTDRIEEIYEEIRACYNTIVLAICPNQLVNAKYLI